MTLTCYSQAPNVQWKIYLPTDLLDTAARWYHLALGHIGQNRLYDTMAQHLYHPDLRNIVEAVVTTCDICQRQKQPGRGYGEAPPREANIHPWREVAVDTIGPWTLEVGKHLLEFRALTMIDMVTNLVELVRLDNMTAAHVGLLFETQWLARYPRPLYCVHDQGTEFTGYQFQRVLARHDIRPRPITTKNPQANSICERMHQTIGNNLRAMVALNPPQGVETANQMVDTALANCLYATRAAFHSSLHGSPGSLAFGRDMVLDIPVIADWLTIQQHRQQLIDQRLVTANRKRISYDYQVGDEVLKLAYKPDKLSARADDGPYTIETIHTNGTVTIRLDENTLERINIRRLRPYRR
jgi:transposase InsO family protein